MELKDKNLVDWLRIQPLKKFPGGKSYITRYDLTAEFLTQEVHPLLSTGAALADGTFLNDHGPEHIEAVIQRASGLALAKECKLEPYEVYLLVTAIQIHDVGNILGRLGHEKLPDDQEGKLDKLLGDHRFEKRLIRDIARAHGGSIDGDKDTIMRLESRTTILGKVVRPRLLAAMLRFADELADDQTRAARFALDVGAVPESSVIYHRYSSALHSVVVDVRGRTVELHFSISEKEAKMRFLKDGAHTYILDEIIARTLKMHRERVYCTRFTRGHISLDSITVKISVFPEDPYDPALAIGYRLEDRGYPDSKADIYEMCPELSAWHKGAPLSGNTLAVRLEEGENKK